ncbi:MAG TPA: hypothetical protein VKT51_07525 [Candidatus Eremiobacteraceae bacterium]|nr:hypothetical protein [Candidatus Eremiobacteraceae bacterium]
MGKQAYPFTKHDHGNELLEKSGTALLIGLCLEQQVHSAKAMIGPYELQKRIGHLDARKISLMKPEALEKVFREESAIHRFPSMMAKRVQKLCGVIADEYDNRGERVWTGITKAEELYGRFLALPGFGEGKAAAAVRILATFGGHRTTGWEKYSSPEDMPWTYKDGVIERPAD